MAIGVVKRLLSIRTEKQAEPLHRRRQGRRTAILNVMIFLKWVKVEHGVQKCDWPPKRERDPEEYTGEETETLLDYANDEDRLVLSSFLCSGFRSGDVLPKPAAAAQFQRRSHALHVFSGELGLGWAKGE